MAYGVPSWLDGAIDLAIRVDLQVQARQQERLQMRHLAVADEFPMGVVPRPAALSGEEEPMQLGCTSLTGEERSRCCRSNLCLCCSGQGHFVATCPVKALTHL